VTLPRRSNLWELEEAQRCLREGDLVMVERYLAKALALVRCVYCHGSLDDGRPYHPHFKGFVHEGCANLLARALPRGSGTASRAGHG